jgi:hypothetical protein
MMANRAPLLIVSLVLLAAAPPVAAHHSFCADYGQEKDTLTGTVTRVEWRNPHVLYFMDVKDEATGKTTNVRVELGPPHLLKGAVPPIIQETIKVGDQLTASGSLNRPRTAMGCFTKILNVTPAAKSPNPNP